MPSVLRREATPNPYAFKYHTGAPLLASGTLDFTSARAAVRVPLARTILDLPSVKQVFIADDFVSISADQWADWEDIELVLSEQLESYDATEASRYAAELAAAEATARENAAPNETLDKINDLIDKYVRPALAGDGGGLQVLGIEGKVVTVRYQGACGSCPSSTAGTLRAIEGLLQHQLDPEITLLSA